MHQVRAKLDVCVGVLIAQSVACGCGASGSPGSTAALDTGASSCADADRATADCSAPNAAGSVAERVAALVQPLLTGEWIMGVQVALIAQSQAQSYGFGAVRDGGPVPDPQTVFELGSVTKTFTGLLLADLVREGQVALEQPVAELLPSGTRVPDFQGRAITLLDLATHTSGLPRLPDNLLPPPVLPEHTLDPYAGYTEADLLAFLTDYELPVEPGTRSEYSNLGVALLGYALSRVNGTSYEEAVRTRITQPLGLPDTTITLTPEQSTRFATGYSVQLEPRPPWSSLDSSAGAIALRGTSQDMARYVLAQIQAQSRNALDAGAEEAASLAPASLLRSMALSQIPRRSDDGTGSAALGWAINADGVIWHNGATGGFEAIVLFDGAARVGAVVLGNTNAAEPWLDQLGFQLIELLRGREPQALQLPPTVRLSPTELERFVGRYAFGSPDNVLSITRDGARLHAELTDQSPLRLFASATDVLTIREPAVVLRFEPTENPLFQNATVEQDGRQTLATRL
jgi:CubicO group peptidase (beta-lactamase class C family)